MHGPSTDAGDEQIAVINIIPLVDVVLVLLIIFMVTTVFSKDSKLDVDLPTGSRADHQAQPPGEITVSLDRDANIFVNGQPATVKQIGQKINGLRNINRKTVVVVRADRRVKYGDVVPVMDEVSRTGMEMTLAILPGQLGEKP